MNVLFLILFLMDAALHLMVCLPFSRKRHTLQGVTKALLMPLLLGCYCFYADAPAAAVILALVFCMIGDVFLIFSGKLAFFAAGLAAFAAGHICYTVYLLGHLPKRPSLLLAAVAILVYAGLIALTIYKQSRYYPPALAVPCCAYMGLISLMSLSALLFAAANGGIASIFVCIGSVFFLVSDTILSENAFHREHPLGTFAVMTTYILAQTCIVFGCALTGGVI